MPDEMEEAGAPLEGLGLRLGIAIALRNTTTGKLLKKLRHDGIASKSSLYNHLNGTSRPARKTIRDYERLLSLPEGWLADESVGLDELREASAALASDDKTHPMLVRLLEEISRDKAVAPPINHPTQEIVPDSSIISQIRHIPILSDAKVAFWLAGERAFGMLTAQTIAIAGWQQVGPRAFGYQMAATDRSMMSNSPNERSYPPSTVLIIDPDQPIVPGDRILARLRDDGPWLVRRYHASWPLASAKTFALYANNPSFDPIRVTNPRDWEIGGRVMYSVQPE